MAILAHVSLTIGGSACPTLVFVHIESFGASVSANLAFPDLSRTPGVHLSSQGMKLPASLGQKRIRVIENFLSHYQMGECGSCGPALRSYLDSTLLLQPVFSSRRGGGCSDGSSSTTIWRVGFIYESG
ncbi:hypothetical protein TcWFU_001236 [Taenia crassiceps]|uniref:DNA methyltransferase 1-associated 1 domain-containing protein n=1 Tax=Taenia crassiceps TaxID=6207 RepID=A0ABR4Q0P9_9CEST